MDNEIRPVEIKDLNKTQLILLAILLSFVVSIATGIVTVTLMQQASPVVNQTINRVVQQTIEKVVPDYSSTKIQTVVVKEDDLVVDAIYKTRATIAEVFASKDSTEVLGEAYSISTGTFIVSSSNIDKTKLYTLKIGDALYESTVSGVSTFSFAVLSINKIDDIVKKLPVSTLTNDSNVKPGQTIAVINLNSIAKGTVGSIVPKEQKDEEGKLVSSWNVISTSAVNLGDMIGSLVLNLDGNVVGIVIPKGDTSAQILGIDSVTKFISDNAIKATIPKQPA
ncbi:MAG: trypsin-like peptidase domain-containing protein [Candidatus Pacebacteria bacterium]|nr:trypsin-like peptidase domain-containing protein [Candidatus Paceibacterota bacterium]